MEMPNQDYQKEYSENSFWDKVKNTLKIAGKEIIVKALTLFYCAQDKDVQLKDKTIIYSALGYFILPIDFIPDTIPLVGFSDDMGALILAYSTIFNNIKQEHKDKAEQKAEALFK
ncbi:MAG: hypothetical protein BWY22_02051 [Bacteroidetes bacterium ADurb.Bin217]|nr:MAG: hypothetical protein BWY22_02051 [Bacteroidetes bacterium ADurb.Bin217]